ncbi:MAG: zf-HC2 domain-containing protein, partial [Actinomycetota bacterium]|nr:zf-HC2 domain-containing protein [Actinomycetota bacterium]
MTTTWHVDDAALTRWVEGTDGSVAGASVEQHLLTCAECRAKVTPEPLVDQVWNRVRDVVEVPRVSWLEHLLRRTGLPPADARIVAVSPAFRGAWLVGLMTLLAFVTAAGGYGAGRGQLAFLVIAPLVPALAVALGYDPELDEALESECATPYSRFRLVLLRSAALLVVAVPAFVVASLLLPGSIAFWWLLPAAACTALVLALSTWLVPL